MEGVSNTDDLLFSIVSFVGRGRGCVSNTSNVAGRVKFAYTWIQETINKWNASASQNKFSSQHPSSYYSIYSLSQQPSFRESSFPSQATLFSPNDIPTISLSDSSFKPEIKVKADVTETKTIIAETQTIKKKEKQRVKFGKKLDKNKLPKTFNIFSVSSNESFIMDSPKKNQEHEKRSFAASVFLPLYETTKKQDEDY